MPRCRYIWKGWKSKNCHQRLHNVKSDTSTMSGMAFRAGKGARRSILQKHVCSLSDMTLRSSCDFSNNLILGNSTMHRGLSQNPLTLRLRVKCENCIRTQTSASSSCKIFLPRNVFMPSWQRDRSLSQQIFTVAHEESHYGHVNCNKYLAGRKKKKPDTSKEREWKWKRRGQYDHKGCSFGIKLNKHLSFLYVYRLNNIWTSEHFI